MTKDLVRSYASTPLLLICSLIGLANYALGDSPSVGHEMVSDGSCGDYFQYDSPTQCHDRHLFINGKEFLGPDKPRPEIMAMLAQLSDIRTITYASNGRFLNATFWLSHPFEMNPPVSERRYQILIGVPNHDDNTPGFPNDYSVSIEWHNGTWSKRFSELSPSRDRAIIWSIDNYTNFSDPLNRNVTRLSFDLGEINFPDTYSILFEANDYFKVGPDNYIMSDNACTDSAIYCSTLIPFPIIKDFEITTSPSPVLVRQGETKTVTTVCKI